MMRPVFRVVLLISFLTPMYSSYANCVGYSGPGGDAYTGPGGAYTGPGGGAYTGPGGGCYSDPGGGGTDSWNRPNSNCK